VPHDPNIQQIHMGEGNITNDEGTEVELTTLFHK